MIKKERVTENGRIEPEAEFLREENWKNRRKTKSNSNSFQINVSTSRLWQTSEYCRCSWSN
jgi:hypothetical protein